MSEAKFIMHNTMKSLMKSHALKTLNLLDLYYLVGVLYASVSMSVCHCVVSTVNLDRIEDVFWDVSTTLDHMFAKMNLDGVVSYDSTVAFNNFHVALSTSSSIMWRNDTSKSCIFSFSFFAMLIGKLV